MRDKWCPPDLSGQVALVSGASRGGGRGVSLVLADAGATVYITGRKSRPSGRPRNFPWTLEETSKLIRARGGKAVPVHCDHTDARQVRALLGRIRRRENRLDILVNNAWGGYERNKAGLPEGRFWEQPLWNWEAMFEAGLQAHLLTSYFAIPLMLRRRRGLIVNTIAWDRGKYLLNLHYDLAKQSIRRLAYDLSIELRQYGICAVALAPGFMRTELVMEAHRAHPFDLGGTESPEYLGRAVASLAADPRRMDRSGEVLEVGTLAREYGFSDVDGRRPRPFRMPAGMLKD